jgi:(1->4)-alpha-D-glucan 1-alpha-D-glucosylmutase
VRVPVATFRLQFRAGTTFDDARRAVPFLDELGVDTLYASPILAARAGSEHGYDCVDPGRLDPSLGDEAAFVKLVDELRAHGMGLVVDLVPNHMAASTENPWWLDVLRHGRASRFAPYFDVDWEAPGADGRVLVPVLGDPYGDVLERGELRVVEEDGERWVRYFDQRFPLAPGTARGPMTRFDGVAGDPGSWAALDELLGKQHYRLAFWRVAGREIDYRRFFDIADLVGVRVEDPDVFEATHAYVASLVERGLVDGLRIDHVDGLLDPHAYLELLQATMAGRGRARYVVVEKILAVGESLPGEWPVAGTTGYDFLRTLNDVFVDELGEARLEAFYRSLRDTPASFEDLVRSRKRMVLRELFGAEIASLVRRLKALAMQDRHARDLTIDELGESLREVTACLEVYRTYAREGEDVRPADRHAIEEAVRCARGRLPAWFGGALDFVRGVVLLEDGSLDERLAFVQRWQQLSGAVMAKGLEDTALYVYNRLVSRNDVGSDPASPAPPVEDFHRENRARLRRWPGSLLATSTHDTKRSEDVRARINVLSEIPDRWAEHVQRWIRWNRVRKREVGGRMVPDRNEEMLLYQTLVGAWPLVEGERRELARRVKAYMVKAAREAKVHTSWTRPDTAHEAALERFVGSILASSNRRFREDFGELEQVAAFHGAVNGLAQVVLKVASPGVPDFYQGTSLWNLSLVDPDNRREVDLERHRDLLEELDRDEPEPADLLDTWRDGRVKLWVTSRALRLRRQEPDLFLRGEYLALQARGRRSGNVCAFARRGNGGRWAVAVVPILSTFAGEGRWPVGYGAWGRTVLDLPVGAPSRWQNIFTWERVQTRPDGSIRMADALRSFPVALLVPA